MNEGRKLLTLTIILLCSITTITVFNRALDRYFVWVHLSDESLMVYWWRGTILIPNLPFKTGSSVWIPVVPLVAVVAYTVLMERVLNIRVFVRGVRIHHYHMGLLSLALSALMTSISMSSLAKHGVVQFGWKDAAIYEVTNGLSLIFVVGGVLLILLDVEDVAETLTKIISRLREVLRK